MKERWTHVRGYKAYYEVSNKGRVRSARNSTSAKIGHILSPNRIRKYLHVHLYKNGKRKRMAIHQLVIRAFLGKMPLNKEEIHHKDENGRNNKISNLCYVSKKENQKFAACKRRGEAGGNSKLTEKKVLRIRFMLHKGVYQKVLAQKFGVCKDTIMKIGQRKLWSHI